MFDPTQVDEQAFVRHRALAAVLAHVEAHPTQALSLRQAAAIACLEAKYFSALFRDRVGVSFKRWEIWRRVQRARLLVVERTDLTIGQIATESGFADLRTFERAFRRAFETTPQAVRRALAGAAAGGGNAE